MEVCKYVYRSSHWNIRQLWHFIRELIAVKCRCLRLSTTPFGFPGPGAPVIAVKVVVAGMRIVFVDIYNLDPSDLSMILD